MRLLPAGLLLCLLLAGTATAQEDPVKRAAWRDGAITKLKSVVPTNTTPRAEIQIKSNGKVLRYFIEQEALIDFGTNGWIYIKIHSEDWGTKDAEKIGDLALAVDHNGTLYETDADTCGGLIIKSPTAKEFVSLPEFLGALISRRHKWREVQESGVGGSSISNSQAEK
jgi:hypothetical protein